MLCILASAFLRALRKLVQQVERCAGRQRIDVERRETRDELALFRRGVRADSKLSSDCGLCGQ